jgi:hypothetical protein
MKGLVLTLAVLAATAFAAERTVLFEEYTQTG